MNLTKTRVPGSGTVEMPRYATLSAALHGVCATWCDEHGYTEPFCRNGEWWAFPPNSVMPVRIATVMARDCKFIVKIGRVTLALLPDGRIAHGDFALSR
ncbi:MAG: hypothetical protein AAGF24_13285 [Cyanobacteria bacterium P01_H01_bin.121]